MLGVCGGYQLLGRSKDVLGEQEIPGVGLLDVHTVREERVPPDRQHRHRRRLCQMMAANPECSVLAGFENHGGRTHLGDGEGGRSGGC